jgi:hypothetical protein
MRLLLIALPLALLAPQVPAQTQARQAHVYRCGPEGRDLRDSPCPGGTASAGNTSNTGGSAVTYDEPSAADSKAARERHLADAKQAAALAAARRASEAEARHQRAQHIGLQTQPAPAQAASAPAVTPLKPPKAARPAKPRKPTAGASSAAR